MPTYDYYCPSNDRTVEVVHRMAETLRTWGEVCERAGLDLGDTPAEAPVERVITGAAGIVGGTYASDPPPSGGGCAGGMCGCGG